MNQSTFNQAQLQYLNALAENPIVKEFTHVSTEGTKVIISWIDAWDEEYTWEIEHTGVITVSVRSTKIIETSWERQSDLAAYLEGTTIDLDDAYMFEQIEEENI